MGRLSPVVNREWAAQERELAELVGLDLWGDWEPAFFSDLEKRKALQQFDVPESYEILLQKVGYRHKFRWKKKYLFYNRFFKELVSFQFNVVIGSFFKKRELKLLKKMGLTTIQLSQDLNFREIDSVVERLHELAKPMDG